MISRTQKQRGLTNAKGDRSQALSGAEDRDVFERAAAARIKRVGLGALMVLVSINIWTGSPLAALWIASRFQRIQGDERLTMAALFVFAIAFAGISFALIRLLAQLEVWYEGPTGMKPVRRHVPWLRSMRGERALYPGDKPIVTILDRILVITVVIAALVFEIWFFFYAGSPIPTWGPYAN